MSTRIDRRQLLVRLVTTTAGVGVGLFAAACSKDGEKQAAALTCTDTTGLTPDDVKLRTELLAYVDKSPDATKKCSGCAQYKVATTAGGCGGCIVLKGPIHPDGWCKSYTPKQA